MEQSIIFDPEVPDRELQREVSKIDDALAETGTISPQMDGVGGVSGGGGGGGAGFGAGALASRIPKPISGVLSSAAVPMALAGGVGVGLLSAMHSASARLQTSTSMLGIAVDNFFRAPGEVLDENIVRPLAREVLDVSVDWDQLAREEGIAFAVGAISRDAADALAKAIKRGLSGEGGGGGVTGGGATGGGYMFPGLSPDTIDRILSDFFEGADLSGVADEIRRINNTTDAMQAGVGDFETAVEGAKRAIGLFEDGVAAVERAINQHWPPTIPDISIPRYKFGIPPIDIPRYKFGIPDINIPRFKFNIPEIGVPEYRFNIPDISIPSYKFEIPTIKIPEWKFDIPFLGGNGGSSGFGFDFDPGEIFTSSILGDVAPMTRFGRNFIFNETEDLLDEMEHQTFESRGGFQDALTRRLGGLLRIPEREFDDLAAALEGLINQLDNTAGGNSGLSTESTSGTNAITSRLDDVNRNVKRLSRDLENMAVVIDGERLGRVVTESQNDQLWDTDPTVQ